MRKKINVVLLVVAFILVVILYVFRTISLEQKILSDLNSSDYSIVCVEMMKVNEDPIVVDIENPDDKDMISSYINNTRIRYKKHEIGMEITSVLYTLTVDSGEDILSLTVNQDNEVHINADEITYSIVHGDDFYKILSDVFENNR